MTSKGRKRLILLDYDGTLLPLQRRIDRSFLPPTTRGMLRRLARRHRVVFVTGREVRDLLRLAGALKGMGIIGTHGLEVHGIPGLRLADKARLGRLMRDREALVKALRLEFSGEPQVFLQIKRYALSAHFPHHGRGEAGRIARFRRVVRRVASKDLWEFQAGKHMIDLRPRGFSKAAAVEKLLKLHPGWPVLYAGDDRSDRPVLKVLRGRGLRLGVGPVIPQRDCDLWFPTPRSFVDWLKDY